MMPEWIVRVIVWVLLCVGAILAIGQYIALRRVLGQSQPEPAEGILVGDFDLGIRGAIGRGATALHGHLDLDGLRLYYESI